MVPSKWLILQRMIVSISHNSNKQQKSTASPDFRVACTVWCRTIQLCINPSSHVSLLWLFSQLFDEMRLARCHFLNPLPCGLTLIYYANEIECYESLNAAQILIRASRSMLQCHVPPSNPIMGEFIAVSLSQCCPNFHASLLIYVTMW